MSVLEQNSRKKALLGEDGSSLTMLLIFNAVIFVLLNFVKVIYLMNSLDIAAFTNDIMSWIAVPSSADTFATRPWTLVTYMFSHVSLWHLISSLLWLWGFGYILNDLTGNKKVVPLYLYGGLAGSVAFLLMINLVPSLRVHAHNGATLLGAGPALMAIAIGTTTLSPRYKIFPLINGGVPLWVFTAIFVVIHIATMGPNVGAASALSAGGAVGFIFIWQLKKGNDLGQWMTDLVNWVDDLFNPERKHHAQAVKQQLFYKANQKPFEKTPHITQQRIDELLDKINQKGYFALSDEEKDFLTKAAKEDL